MAFTNKAEKGAVQRGKTGTASMVNKAEKGAVQNGYTAAAGRQPRPTAQYFDGPTIA